MNPQLLLGVSSLLTFGWVLASADAPRDGAAADDTARLVGTWRCVSAVVNGKPLPDAMVKQLELTLTRNGYKTERADEVLFDSTYSLDAKPTPAHIDIVGTEGEAAGKIAPGIYSLEKDGGRQVLKICYVMPGGERPNAFESAVASNAFFATWERENAGDK
jgi:uncharacterized protein (TIGR03067 family)